MSMCYWYVNHSLKKRVYDNLKEYTNERAYFENRIFDEAQKNTYLLAKKFHQIHSKPKEYDYQKRFEFLTPLRKNGKVGPHLGYKRHQEAGIIIDSKAKVSEEMKQILVDAYTIVDTMGEAWKESFLATYLINDYFTLIYEEQDLLMHEANEFSYGELDIIKFGKPEYNPEREAKWVPVYYEPVTNLAMTSVIRPLYVNNKHVGNFCLDLLLAEMFGRLTEKQLKGTQFALVDNYGQIIAHSEMMDQLINNEEAFRRETTTNPDLESIFEAVDQA